MIIINIKFINEGIVFTLAMEEAVKAETKKLEKYGVTSLRIRADRQPRHQVVVSAVCVSDRAEGFAAKAEADDFYKAVPAVVEKLRRQLRAEKTKVLSKREKAKKEEKVLEETQVESIRDRVDEAIVEAVLGTCFKIANSYFPGCTSPIVKNLMESESAASDLADIIGTLSDAVPDAMEELFGHSESDKPDEYDAAVSEVVNDPYFRLLMDGACTDAILDFLSDQLCEEMEVA